MDDVYYEYDFSPNLSVGPNNPYKSLLIRYKCSNANVKAEVEYVYTGPEYQSVLPSTNNELFTAYSANLVADKTLDKIRLYANDDEGAVYYDFHLLYDAIYTFPNAGLLVDPYLPEARIADIVIPGKDGLVQQNLGSDLSKIHIVADMDVEDWGTPKGKWLQQIVHEQSSELWQWWTFPSHGWKFKGYVKNARQPFTDRKMGLDMWVHEYKLGSATEIETYAERFGH